jgi:DNA (cytosine-5)-methyltransferase 1
MEGNHLMSRPKILDLFCGAGGAAMGYHRAGFDVMGVDIKPQPGYPFECRVDDALFVLRWLIDPTHGIGPYQLSDFDAIHASPPCQFATAYRRRNGVALDAVNLIPETRELLEASGLPYVIENVEQAREYLRDPVMLCGSAFGDDLERHRLFETNWPLMGAPCAHGRNDPEWPQATNRANKRRTVEVGAWRIPLADQQKAMGIDWMTLEELSQAIPPAYTELIGHQLMQQIRMAA